MTDQSSLIEAFLGQTRPAPDDAESLIARLSATIELPQVAGLLRLYCKALTGAEVQVLPAQQPPQQGMSWVAEPLLGGTSANVYLPPILQQYETTAQNFAYLKVEATHQIAHLEFGSYAFQFAAAGLLFPRLRGMVEHALGRRRGSSTDMERFFNLFKVRALATDIFTVLEDGRTDGFIRRGYLGIRRSLQQVQRDTRSDRPPVVILYLRSAFLEALLQQSLDPAQPVLFPEIFHRHFAVAWAYLARLMEQASSVEDAAEACLRLYLILRAVPNLDPESSEILLWAPVPLPTIADPERAFADLLALESATGPEVGRLLKRADMEQEDNPYSSLAPVGFRGDFTPELIQQTMARELAEKAPSRPPMTRDHEEATTTQEKPKPDDLSDSEIVLIETTLDPTNAQPLTEEEQQDPAIQEALKRQEKKGREDDGQQLNQPAEYIYKEWDFRRYAYRPNWCLVREQVLSEGGTDFYNDTLRTYTRLAQEVQRQFQLLKPQLFKKIKNLPDGEDYDLDAVIQAAVDRRAGQPPSEKLYWRRNKEERSVAVAFLVDLSASTDENIKREANPLPRWQDLRGSSARPVASARASASPQESGNKTLRRIIDVEKESIVLLIQALETVGDSYGVYGFSGHGRNNVEVYVIKDLGEQLNDTVKGRISQMEPVRSTRMGAAIRHTVSKLEAFDARAKVLLLLSDGRPQDKDYGRDSTERAYALHDTKKALLEAKEQHIIPFAITVDQKGHDYLKTMCADMGYEIVDDIESLPSRLPTLYRLLTF